MAMTRISPDTRAALLVTAGSVLLLTPFPIGLAAAAVAAAAVIGALLIGLGLAGTANSGRGTIPLSAHRAYDQGIGTGLVLGALVFAVAGDALAAAMFAAVGLALWAVSVATRYSAPASA